MDRYGEFWIMGGITVGADGDIGDMNHEAYVVDAVRSNYMDNPEQDWEEFKKQIAQIQAQKTKNKKLSINDLAFQYLQEKGMSREEFDIAEGIGDARDYGVKKLGWIRVKGTSVEVWNLTPSVLNEIANGLWDAYDEDIRLETIDIEVRSTNTLYESIPFEVLEQDNIMALRGYARKYAKNWYKKILSSDLSLPKT